MSKKKSNNIFKKILILVLFTIILGIVGYFNNNTVHNNFISTSNIISTDIQNIPAYSGNPYIILNNNKPSFTENDYTTNAFETYSDLDRQGRCGVAYANICKEVMPLETDERESISSVIPSGWEQTAYEGIIEGNYLYNRCHLIGHQLAGENANEKNLITGTRYMNTEGMLPFENDIDDYIEKMKIIMFYIELLLFFMVTISLQVVCRWKHILLKIMEKVFALMFMFIMFNLAL